MRRRDEFHIRIHENEGDKPFQTFLIQATASYAAIYLFVMTTTIAQLVKLKPDNWMAHEGLPGNQFC